MEWEVVATDKGGAKKRVKVKASSEASARQKVANAGYEVISLKELATSTPAQAPAQASAPAHYVDPLAQLAGAVSTKRPVAAQPPVHRPPQQAPTPPYVAQVPQYAAPTTPYAPARPNGIQCQTCHTGTMVRRKKHRLSGPAVVIGYIFLIPSVLGILICVLLAIASAGTGAAAASSASSGDFKKESDSRIEADLTGHFVPPAVRQKVLAGEPIPETTMMSLPSGQQDAVREAEARMLGQKMAAGVAGGIGALGATAFLCVGFACFCSGLLGWILVMKKKILQCNHCQAVVAAS